MSVLPSSVDSSEPAHVVVVGEPVHTLPGAMTAPHRLSHVEAIASDAALSPDDVVVLHWESSAASGEAIADLMHRPDRERPHVVVTGEIPEAAMKAMIERHGVVNVVGARGPHADHDLAITIDKLLANDLFGLARYFDGEAAVARYRCTAVDRAEMFAWLNDYAKTHGIRRRFVDILHVVADEMVTNAIYNAPTDASGHHTHAATPRTTKFELDNQAAVEIELRCDGRRLGISTVDPFGSLEPDVVISSLRRCFERAEPREGPGGAGLGLYLLLGSVSHVVFNLARGRRTEVIGLMDISGGIRTLVGSGKSFNLFVER